MLIVKPGAENAEFDLRKLLAKLRITKLINRHHMFFPRGHKTIRDDHKKLHKESES